MKLQIARPDGWNAFTAYANDYVSINALRFAHSLVVLPDRIVNDWGPTHFDGLTEAMFDVLSALDAEVVLLGTGSTQRFPNPGLLQPLMRTRRGFEIMDNHAACRTYNVLAGEGRRVAAAIILPGTHPVSESV